MTRSEYEAKLLALGWPAMDDYHHSPCATGCPGGWTAGAQVLSGNALVAMVSTGPATTIQEARVEAVKRVAEWEAAERKPQCFHEDEDTATCSKCGMALVVRGG